MLPLVLRCVIVVLAFATVPAWAASGWQDVPEALQLQRLGDTLAVNGIPMQVRSFVTTMPIDEVLREVSANWERHPGGQEVKRTNMTAWTVLNQTVGEEHRSLQVRNSGPSTVEGFVALTSPRQAREPKLAVRLPSGITPVSVIDSVDRGKASQQIVAVSNRSPTATASALEASLKTEGWQRHVYKQQGAVVIFAANRGNQQFDATLSAQKAGALVMINTIKN